ncbi:MAG: hypothetical protein ACFHWZ_08615 [Phycisphaerales bacterium]
MATTSTYFYSAMKLTGGKARGVRSARDQRQLSDELRGAGLLLVRLEAARGLFRRCAGFRQGPPAAVGRSRAEQPAPRAAVAWRAAGRGAGGRRGRGFRSVERCVQKLRELVAAGTSFAKACKEVGGFDEVAISVYKAAERTGDLAALRGGSPKRRSGASRSAARPPP